MVHIKYLFKYDYESEGYKTAIKAYERGGVSSVIWSITNECNLRCIFCYMKAGSKLEDELTTSEALQLIDELVELGKPLLFITGGEPLLRSDIFEILKYASDNGLRIILSTNGSLITRDVASSLARIGVHYIALPFYGDRVLHEYYTRVYGSFDMVLKAISKLKERGLRVGFKVIALKPVFKVFDKIMEYADRLKIDLIYICDLIPFGYGVNLINEALDVGSWRNLLDMIIESIILSDRYGFDIDIGAHPSSAIYILERLKSLDYDVSKALNKMSRRKLCPVGRGFIAISSNGNILPCNFLPIYSIGNIRNYRLRDLIKSPDLTSLGDSNKLNGYCLKCKYRDICGGCRVKAYLSNGDIYSSDPTCIIR